MGCRNSRSTSEIKAIFKASEAKVTPEVKMTPETKADPEVKVIPEVKAIPEVKVDPEDEKIPEIKAIPEVKVDPEDEKIPEIKAIPQVKSKNKGKDLGPLKRLQYDQLRRLEKKVGQLKSQIVEIANALVLSVKLSVKNSLYCLNQQNLKLKEIILTGQTENQINDLLGVVPDMELGSQNLVDIELKLSLKEFTEKIQEIEKKYNPKGIIMHQPTVNPVLQSLEKLDLSGKIDWCRRQYFTMISQDNLIKEIRITKDANFVFLSIDYTVCKV